MSSRFSPEDVVDGEPLLTVAATDEPDEVFDFPAEGTGRLFGRDDSVCDIVIWSALRGTDLSRVAGRIWRRDGELWLRNLSTRHELHLTRPGSPAPEPLPPRRSDGPDPGPARSLPPGVSYVQAPGGCELVVRQQPMVVDLPVGSGEMTTRVPPVPPDLRAVAAALCEPLLAGGRLPAAYAEITRRAGTGSVKRSRTLVARLCELYVTEVPWLHDRIRRRIDDEDAELRLTGLARLSRGVWVFDTDSRAPAAPPPTGGEERELGRRRALALPDYYEVAHLLVRRRMVTAADVAALDPAPPRSAKAAQDAAAGGEPA